MVSIGEGTTTWCEPTPSRQGTLCSSSCYKYLRTPEQILANGAPVYKTVENKELTLSHITYFKKAHEYVVNDAFKSKEPIYSPIKSSPFKSRTGRNQVPNALKNALSFRLSCSAEHNTGIAYGNVEFQSIVPIINTRLIYAQWYLLEYTEFYQVTYAKIVATTHQEEELDNYHQLTKVTKGEPIYYDRRQDKWHVLAQLESLNTFYNNNVLIEFVVADDNILGSLYPLMSPKPFYPRESQKHLPMRGYIFKENETRMQWKDQEFDVKSIVESYIRTLGELKDTPTLGTSEKRLKVEGYDVAMHLGDERLQSLVDYVKSSLYRWIGWPQDQNSLEEAVSKLLHALLVLLKNRGFVLTYPMEEDVEQDDMHQEQNVVYELD